MTIGIHGSQARLYINDLDMSLYVEQVDQEITRATAEHTPLAAQTTNRAVGVNSVTLNLTGSAYVADSNAAHHWEQAQASDNALYAFVPGGDVVGRVVYCAHSMQGDMSITAPSSDIVRIPFGHLGTGQLDRARILRAMAVGGTSPGVHVDGTALSSGGGAAYVFCSDMTGTDPTLTVTIQHSADEATWVPLAGMETLLAPGALKLQIHPTGALPIVGADTVADEIDVAGDWSRAFIPGVCFEIVGSTGNNGIYTTGASIYDALTNETTIAVAENIADGTADGTAEIGDVRQYVRVSWTLTGTSPTARWFAAFARH